MNATLSASLERPFSGSLLEHATADLARMRGEAALDLWLLLAPALLRDPTDAALWLFLRDPGSWQLYASLQPAIVQWWASSGGSPGLAGTLDASAVRQLDHDLSAFLVERRFGAEVRDLLPSSAAGAAGAGEVTAPLPAVERVLAEAAAAARDVFPALEDQNYLVWDRAHREVPERPWTWLLVHALARVTTDSHVVGTVRRAILNAGERADSSIAEIQANLNVLDPPLARVIRSLGE